tara:strand:- start:424 stop:624 length:201 start_codon:yes stop_codon:yes gene_type:complete
MDVNRRITVMQKVAYSAKELAEMGIGSESHVRRMMKAGEIPVVKLGNRELIPAYWVEENFVKPNAA